jgi:hypothetical protein
MRTFIKRILIILGIAIIMTIAITFRYFIDKQEPLCIEELNKIVEKEIIEIYGH